jgi:hypothetical protein
MERSVAMTAAEAVAEPVDGMKSAWMTGHVVPLIVRGRNVETTAAGEAAEPADGMKSV